MKKRVLFSFVFLFSIFISLSFVSAGIGDWFKDIFGGGVMLSPDGVAAHYSFEGDLVDVVGNADMDLMSGPVEAEPAKIGEGAYMQNGASLRILNRKMAPGTGEGSISFWMIMSNDTTGTQGMTLKKWSTNPWPGFKFDAVEQGVRFWAGGTGGENWANCYGDYLGEFHHFVITAKEGGKKRIYVDGELCVENNVGTQGLTVENNLFITTSTEIIIDELKMWVKELTADEVCDEYGDCADEDAISSPNCVQLYGLIESGMSVNCGEANYDSRADIDKSGKIDVGDFSFFAPNRDNETYCGNVLSDTSSPCEGDETCVDSDGGQNKSVVGTCTDINGNSYTDVCSPAVPRDVHEYYCQEDGSCRIYPMTCFNENCVNGRCLGEDTPIPNNTTCTDSDGGLDYSVFGTGTLVNSHDDECTGAKLYEHACNINIKKNDIFYVEINGAEYQIKYKGSDKLTDTSPKVSFELMGQVQEVSLNMDGTFNWMLAGKTLNFINASNGNANDFDISLLGKEYLVKQDRNYAECINGCENGVCVGGNEENCTATPFQDQDGDGCHAGLDSDCGGIEGVDDASISCNDGIDNDCDGMIDFLDTDGSCVDNSCSRLINRVIGGGDFNLGGINYTSSWSDNYTGSDWFEGEEKSFITYSRNWYPDGWPEDYPYIYLDVQSFDDTSFSAADLIDQFIEPIVCIRDSIWVDGDFDQIYICNWDVLNDNQDLDDYEDIHREILWTNENRLIRMYLSSGRELTDAEIAAIAQQTIGEFLQSLKDNSFNHIDWDNYALPWQSSLAVEGMLEECGSDLEEIDDGCNSCWSCKTEPVICPPHGRQTRVCEDNCCDESPDRLEELYCSPGICAGCFVPRYSWSDEGNNVCIPYGTRFVLEDGEEYRIYEEEMNDEGNGYFDVSINDDNSMTINVIRDLNDDFSITVDGVTYYIKVGESKTIYEGNKYDLTIKDGSYSDDFSITIRDIHYSDSLEDRYIEMVFNEQYPSYCDVDGDIKQQRTVDYRGNWAGCQNNYECESNICSSGECIEVQQMLDQAKGLKGFFVKLVCKLSHVIDVEEYETCVIEIFGGEIEEEEPECDIDADCSDGESTPYCSDDGMSVCTDFFDYDCEDGSCVEVSGGGSCQSCDDGCEDGGCVDDPEPSSSWKVGTSSDKLEIGEPIKNITSYIGEEDFAVLEDGEIINSHGTANYEQFLYFEKPHYAGPYSPGGNSNVVYAEDSDENVGLFFKVDSGEVIARYVMDFTTDLESDLDGTTLEDIEGLDITIIGKTYDIESAESVSSGVNIILGGNGDRIELSNGSAMIVNGEQINDAAVLIVSQNSGSTISITEISVNMTAEDDLFVPVGGKLSQNVDLDEPEVLFTQNWDIEFKGLESTDYEQLSLTNQGDNKIKMLFENYDGNLINFTIFYADSSGIHGGSREGYNLVLDANNNITKNDYFILNTADPMNPDNGARSFVVQYKGSDKVTDTNPTIEFEVLGQSRNAASLSPIGSASMTLAGETFNFQNVSSANSDDFIISLTQEDYALRHTHSWNNYNLTMNFLRTRNNGLINITKFEIPNDKFFDVALYSDDRNRDGDHNKWDDMYDRFENAFTMRYKGVGGEIESQNNYWKLISDPDDNTRMSYVTPYGVDIDYYAPSSSPADLNVRIPSEAVEPLVYFTSGSQLGIGYNVGSINERIINIINNLFVGDQKAVLYLPGRRAEMNQGEPFGLALGIQNIGQTGEFTWEFVVPSDDDLNRKCGFRNENDALDWITSGGSNTRGVEIASEDKYIDLIRFNIPEGSVNSDSQCIVRFQLEIERKEDRSRYTTESFDVVVNQ
jgi:hypothetical protein